MHFARRLSAPIVVLLLSLHGMPLLQAAAPPAATQGVRDLAQAGALQLALQRIDALQPADPADQRWAEWEDLRLQLLDRLDRHEEILRRTATLQATGPAIARAGVHAVAARAAVALGQPALAREHAGRALW